MSRILVVEDSRTQVEHLRLVLEEASYAVEVAPDAERALERFDASDFDLVISDVLMPGLSGYDLCRKLKGHPTKGHVPVVLLTSLNDPLDILRGIECGADNYVTRPFEADALLGRIRYLFANRARPSQCGRLKVGVEVSFFGRTFTINSEKEQILDLLVATCEDVVRANRELHASRAELAASRDELEARVRDRTAELVAANRTMRESEERYRLLFERNLAGVLLSRPSGEILDCNDSFARMLGYASRTEVMAHPATDFYFSPADREALLGELRARRVLTNHEFLMRRRDGSGLWVLANINLLEDARVGTVFHVTLLDISELRRAEEDVRRWRDRYEAAVRASGHILYDADEATGGIAFSGNVQGMLGYQPEELAGPLERWLAVVHPEDQAAVRREVAKVREVDGSFRLEYRVRRKDGAWATVQDRGQALHDGDGRVAHVIGFIMDVTEQRKLEAQLRQAQKMEAVGRLAGGVAHDFNNLVQVVTGYGDLVLAALPEDHPQREAVAEMKKAGERAAALTRQLLAFSRRQVIAPRLLDLNVVARDVERMLRRLIGEDILLTTSLGSSLGRVWADPGQVEQVLVNLCVNARDAMPRGGELTIETSNAELDAEYARAHHEVRPGRYVLLAVSDTGHGMDEATRAHAFEPFFTTKEVGKGTGLGLSTVYGIVKQAGGFVYVYSEPGWGATFKVYLPRVEEHALAEGFHHGPAAPRPAGGSETLLLVEDEGPVRALTREVLSAAGYTVLEAADGNEALLLCERYEGPLHLLVTDVVMPGMGGRGLAECLTALRPGLKVLFLSGYADDAVIRHGVLTSEVDFLHKPFTIEALTRKVREGLDRPARSQQPP